MDSLNVSSFKQVVLGTYILSFAVAFESGISSPTPPAAADTPPSLESKLLLQQCVIFSQISQSDLLVSSMPQVVEQASESVTVKATKQLHMHGNCYLCLLLRLCSIVELAAPQLSQPLQPMVYGTTSKSTPTSSSGELMTNFSVNACDLTLL